MKRLRKQIRKKVKIHNLEAGRSFNCVPLQGCGFAFISRVPAEFAIRKLRRDTI